MIPAPDELILDTDGVIRPYRETAGYGRAEALAAAKVASKTEWLQQRANARAERAAKLADKIRIEETKLAALRRELDALVQK